MSNMINPQEIHEAINAADDALDALRRADNSLSSAGNWGIWDMLGGGFLSAMFKHGRMDQAQREIEEAKQALSRFGRELSDVDRRIDLNIDTGDFLRFADYVFDGFIADWLVQSKIRQGRQKIQQAISMVEDIRSRLWQMLG